MTHRRYLYCSPGSRRCERVRGVRAARRAYSLRAAPAIGAMTGTIASLPGRMTMMKSHFAAGLMPGLTSPVLIPALAAAEATSKVMSVE